MFSQRHGKAPQSTDEQSRIGKCQTWTKFKILDDNFLKDLSVLEVLKEGASSSSFIWFQSLELPPCQHPMMGSQEGSTKQLRKKL